jgi:MoaA/NifB/PqqE/SkfB family radical SAM enzyme
MSDPLNYAATTPPMRRYFEKPEEELTARVSDDPVRLYLETTNRCNLLCTTCPRTYEQLEPEADMSWELFTSIVSQFSGVKRVVLHGVGEPMLVRDLPERIAYLKQRGIYVLFNTNGTLLTEANGERLLDSGLDELRVSLDAAESSVFQMVRGKDMFDRIVTNVTNFRRRQRERDAELPRVSLWLTGLRETIGQLEAFVRLAHKMDVPEVYLQRLVFFDDNAVGLARAESALFEKTTEAEEETIHHTEKIAQSLGVAFNALGGDRARYQH